MSIDRVATSTQTAFMLSQIQNAGAALDKTQEQIASGKNATTYAGFGNQAQVLTASISASARNDAYTNATKFAVTQTDLQDTQLTSLSSLAASLKKAVSDAVANNDATTLMTQAQSIFDQASAILNSKDANGDYIYSGGKTDVPPVTVNSLSALQALPSVSAAFANGNLAKSVEVADGVNVSYGLTASGVATGLMQALQDVGQFDAGPSGNFNAAEPDPGAEHLSHQRHCPDHDGGHKYKCNFGRQWLCLQSSDRRPEPASLHDYALLSIYFQYSGHQHGRCRHPAVAEPDPVAGGLAGHRRAASAFAAELPVVQHGYRRLIAA